MKKTYTILSLLLITLFLCNCGTGGQEGKSSKYPICDTKEKFVVAKVKIITTDVFPTEESNGSQVISSDLINLLLPSNCDCADEKPLIINSDIYRVDTAAHQKIFNHNDVSKFAGNTAKLKFWQNKAEVIKNTPINEILLQPTKPNNLTQKIGAFILKNSKEDSVFVLALANSTKKYLPNGISYRSFDNVDSVRKNIGQIYQKNPKINFTIILNPPSIEEKIAINDLKPVENKSTEIEKIRNPKKIRVVNSVSDDSNLPPQLPIQGIKDEAIKEGNTKDLKLKSKINQ